MFQHAHLLYLGVLVLIVVIYIRRRTHHPLPDLDWLNVRDGEWFNKQRGRIRTVRNGPGTVIEAYEKYSKNNKSCILPGLGHDVVLLPIDCASWLAKHPDDLVNNLPVLQSELQVDYTFPQKRLAANPTHHETMKGDLTHQVAALVPDIVSEMAAALKDEWGTGEEWREVCVFETVGRVLSRSINRVLVGPAFCRNQQMLQSAQAWTRGIPMAATFLFLTPSFLRWMIAPILMYPVTKHVKSFEAILNPEILRRQQADAEKSKPNDFLQWTIDRAKESDDPGEQTAQTIAQRLLLVNFGGTHNTTAAMTIAIFDILASGEDIATSLTAESTAALRQTQDRWNKAVLHQLVKHDSALKESLRLGGIIASGTSRMITAPDGLMSPNGTFLPHGTVVAVPTWGVHREPKLYEEPEQYRPFRFSEMRTGERQDLAKDAKLSATSLSSEYHPFGLGKHACPGRFFALTEMKLLLAYILLTYDFDFNFPSGKPKSMWIGATAMIPPMKATIRIKKKIVKGSQ